ncbi:Uncharacterised protein g8501 [Pycnogonum litorale]
MESVNASSMDVNVSNAAADLDFHSVHSLGSLLHFAAFCVILFIIIGVTGNVLTIVALVKCPKVRSTTAVFIINLCVADTCFCAINLPFTASRFIHKDWIHGEDWCILFPFVRYSNVGVSLLCIVAISINRFVLIAYPRLYNGIYTRRNIAMMIAFIWIFAFSMLFPTLLKKWGRFGYDESIANCSIIPVNGKSSKKFLYVVAFVLPCIVIIVSYAGIFWQFKKSSRRLRQHTVGTSDKRKERKRRKDEWKITCMVLVIFISFMISYLPITIMKVSGADKKHPSLYILGYLLLYMSACINPIIYVIMNKQYRQAYKTILFCMKPGNKSTTSSQKGGTAGAFNNDDNISTQGKSTAISTMSSANIIDNTVTCEQKL